MLTLGTSHADRLFMSKIQKMPQTSPEDVLWIHKIWIGLLDLNMLVFHKREIT